MNPKNSTDQPTILVTGGVNGKTGRRVAERLRARGLPVRAGSRSAEPPFDWTDRATWAQALAGTTEAYVSYVPDLGVPTAPAAMADFAEVALAGGTRRLVLLSGRGEWKLGRHGFVDARRIRVTPSSPGRRVNTAPRGSRAWRGRQQEKRF